ncbi:hypothetical protein ACUYWG_004019 [Escherichia coli]
MALPDAAAPYHPAWKLVCGVVINSGLSASSLDEPASLEWRGMRDILPILDRFEENDQKCIFLRSNLDCFNH